MSSGTVVMDTFFNVAEFVFSALAVYFLFTYFIILVSLLRAPLWQATLTSLVWRPKLEPDQQAAVEELRQLGFEPTTMDRIQIGPLDCPGLFFCNSEGSAFAYIVFSANLVSGFPVIFYSFAANARMLVTVNRVGFFAHAGPDVEVVNAFADSLESHWQAHQDRIKGCDWVGLDSTEAERRVRLVIHNQHLADTGAAVKGRDGAYHFTLRFALRASFEQWKMQFRLRKRYRAAWLSGAVGSLYFANAYNQVELANAARPPRRAVKIGVVAVTLAFSLAFWAEAFSWTYAVILVGVLFVHEIGHAIAMKAFGYRDLNIFFIPFFGAAVSGTAKDMPAWKQAVVLLAGPLPGLIAAVCFLTYRGFYPFETPSYNWSAVAAVAGLVNLANLLPISPLDGGRLLEISVFSRMPRARLAFSALSVLGFSALAVWTDDPGLLPIIGLFALSLFTQWRITDLHLAWKTGLSPREQVIHLFEFACLNFRSNSLLRNYGLIKAVFEQRKVKPARAWEMAVFLFMFLGIWAGVGVAAVQLWPTQKKWNASAARLDARTSAQKAFDKAFYSYDEGADGAPPLTAIEQLGGALQPSDPRLFDLEILKVLSRPAGERLPQLERFLRERRVGYVYDMGNIANMVVSASMEGSSKMDLDQKVSALQGALDRISVLWPENVRVMSYNRVNLAALLVMRGDIGAAEERLRLLQDSLAQTSAGTSVLAQVIRSRAWLKIRQGQPIEARALILDAMERDPSTMRERLALDYAWTLVFADDLPRAEEQMRKATYGTVAPLTFLQNALGKRPKARLNYPLDLAYVLMRAKRREEAELLLKKEAPSACKRKPLSSRLPWDKPRDEALMKTFEALCPAPVGNEQAQRS